MTDQQDLRALASTIHQDLNDLCCDYAHDFCDDADVIAARDRITQHGGILGYITDALEASGRLREGLEQAATLAKTQEGESEESCEGGQPECGPVEGECIHQYKSRNDVFPGWYDEGTGPTPDAWHLDCVQPDHIWREVYTAPPPSQPAVELEQLKKTMGDELLSLAGAMNDARKAKLVYGSLDRIMTLIDGAKAGPKKTEVIARPLSEWHDDDGPVCWWSFPVQEAAWVGGPNDSDWPGYHTHWTPHPPCPTAPSAAPDDTETLGGESVKAMDYTTGHCVYRKGPLGCPFHNLQCGWPNCDRRPATTPDAGARESKR